MLAFDHDAARWRWDLERIHAKGYTDNVVDLMVGKLTRLPAETQKALQQLACLGNVAEIAMLSIVLGTPEEQVARGAVGGGPSGADRAPGRLLQVYPRPGAGSRLFADPGSIARRGPSPDRPAAGGADAAGAAGGGDLRDRQPAQPRRRADHRARRTRAAGRAQPDRRQARQGFDRLCLGAHLSRSLVRRCWRRIAGSAGTSSSLRWSCTGPNASSSPAQLAEAEQRLAALSTRAANTVERATVACLRVDLYTTLDQSSRAIAVGLDYLRHLGIDWSPHPTEEEARREYERIWSQLGQPHDRGL